MGSSCGTEASNVSDDRPPNHKVVTLATSSKATAVSATLGTALSPRRQENTANVALSTRPQRPPVSVRDEAPRIIGCNSRRLLQSDGPRRRRSLPPPAAFTSVAVREEGCCAAAAVDVMYPFGLFDVSDTKGMARFQFHAQPPPAALMGRCGATSSLPQRVGRAGPAAFAVDPNGWSLLQSETGSL
jgi:hypothetical protein